MLSYSSCQILTLHLNVAAEIETHQTRKRFSNLLLSNFGESVWIVSSVSCSYLTAAAPGVVFSCWSPSVSGFDVFRDGILQILVVTSGYLSYCCLSIISNQSVHSPLTSDINKAFSSTQLLLTGYFLVMWCSTQRLRSLYKKTKHLTLKRCIGAWFVLPKARDLWRPKLHSPENHVTASVSASRSEPQHRFLYIITHYNAFALFSFYPNLYIKVKLTLPMK